MDSRPPSGSPLLSANRLLASLPPADYHGLVPGLPLVALERDQVLIAPHRPVERIYFPAGGVCSITVTTVDGQAAAAACIGNEGFVGLTAGDSRWESAHPVVVAIAESHAHVMERSLFEREMNRRGALASIVRAYAHGFVEVLVQSVACNALHPVEKRCARWLLDIADRLGRDDLPVTQDQLAAMLGVRRASVAVATGGLHKAGVLDGGHGLIHIVDRRKLASAACECYLANRAFLSRTASLSGTK